MESFSGKQGVQKPKLLEQVHAAMRLRDYCIRTEEAYVQWGRHYLLFVDVKAYPPNP